ncbi:hypothetical protein [Photobacterium kasasachensis]|uniref:hypothetical protein n=1 Tax=Photobacterium kasasachensis TaxID=2910240 RepID=UPI003D0E61F2
MVDNRFSVYLQYKLNINPNNKVTEMDNTKEQPKQVWVTPKLQEMQHLETKSGGGVGADASGEAS